jgi:hypothetical protein
VDHMLRDLMTTLEVKTPFDLALAPAALSRQRLTEAYQDHPLLHDAVTFLLDFTNPTLNLESLGIARAESTAPDLAATRSLKQSAVATKG